MQVLDLSKHIDQKVRVKFNGGREVEKPLSQSTCSRNSPYNAPSVPSPSRFAISGANNLAVDR